MLKKFLHKLLPKKTIMHNRYTVPQKSIHSSVHQKKHKSISPASFFTWFTPTTDTPSTDCMLPWLLLFYSLCYYHYLFFSFFFLFCLFVCFARNDLHVLTWNAAESTMCPINVSAFMEWCTNCVTAWVPS